MKALIQRVTSASVTVDGSIIGAIDRGLAVLVGISINDSEKDVDYLAQKIVNLRIFADDSGKFNLSALDINGELLLVSQFTLMADTRKGRRPSFIDAAPAEKADALFNYLVNQLQQSGLKTETGQFQAYMQVEIHNDGPVTILLDSTDKIDANRS